MWQAATARARIPEDRRRDASVIIDEAHNVLNLAGSVSDMLAEARGYHLSLVLAHQNLAQVPRDTQLAISANARNKIFFPSRQRTPTNWPATRCRSSTSTTCPTWTPTPPPSASSSTTARPPAFTMTTIRRYQPAVTPTPSATSRPPHTLQDQSARGWPRPCPTDRGPTRGPHTPVSHDGDEARTFREPHSLERR